MSRHPQSNNPDGLLKFGIVIFVLAAFGIFLFVKGVDTGALDFLK